MKTYLVMMLVPVTAESLDSIWDVTHHIPMEEIQRASFVGVLSPKAMDHVTVVKDRFSPLTGASPLHPALVDHGKQVAKPKKRRHYEEH